MNEIALNQPVWLLQVRSVLSWLARQLALVGGVIMLGLAIMTVVSVTGRALFSTAISGDYELVEAGLGIAIFLFLPEGHRACGHVVVDVFTNNLGHKALKTLETIGEVVFLVVSIVMAWQMTLAGFDAYDYMEQSMILELPLWVVYAAGVLVSVLVALRALERIVSYLMGVSE
ncbi:TRAP transporter small permease [Oceanobacter mangrovi]|uniref:TRAP transporter small permease n=1 Tax=Oceanobacter mangrovi TaxID=2862510 RepID=UPI001C8E5C27|nr:TRAP transporter small permease [Oceanobacter mangrovi]